MSGLACVVEIPPGYLFSGFAQQPESLSAIPSRCSISRGNRN
jgi:hypothetical protein